MSEHSLIGATVRPAPLTAADCDLQDFAFMPLDVARLRDSELASNETPEACWAAVLLWAASWHQVPAGSIPNDDKWIAKQAGYAQRGKIAREWAEVRSGALRGWVECDDGRLYHPVVAEKAREAWQAKLRQRWGTECARIKKHNDRHHTQIPKPTFEEWLDAGCPVGQPLFVPRDTPGCPPEVPSELASKRQGEGQGQGDISSEAIASDGSADPAGDSPAAEPPPEPPAPPPPAPPAPSVPKVRTPEEQAKADVWRSAVDVLQAGGCKVEATCRTFMGKLVGDYGFEVVKEAVAAAVANQPAEAREYLKATCQLIAGERKAKEPPPTVPSRAADDTSAYLAEQAAHAAAVKAQRGTRPPIKLPTKEAA